MTTKKNAGARWRPGVQRAGVTTTLIVLFLALGCLLLCHNGLTGPANDDEQTTAPTAVSPEKSTANGVQQWLYWGDTPDQEGRSLNEVLELARRRNPNWKTFAANHAAAHAELVKALAWPNPEFEIEYGHAKAREKDEQGNRPRRNTSALSLSQPIEMPGKRMARQVEAQAGFAVANAEAGEFGTSLRADVIEAYFTVQYHAALERLWQSLLDVAEELQSVADKRVQLGEGTALEQVNAKVDVLKARRELNASHRKLLGARSALNALTGSALGDDFKLSDPLPSALGEQSLEKSVKKAMECHPRLLRMKAELEQKYASIDRERTEWWPDVKIGFQKTKEFDARGNAVTAGIEIPLWNRNQGGVAAATAAAHKLYAEIMAAFEEVRRDVEVAYQNYEIAREEFQVYEEGLKSAAQEALEQAYTQYVQGASGYLDVLNARRLVQETEQEYIQARYDAALSQAQLGRAVGESISAQKAR